MISIAPYLALKYNQLDKKLHDGCENCEHFKGWFNKCSKGYVPKHQYDGCKYNPNKKYDGRF